MGSEFAEFQPDGSLGQWPDVTVREIQPDDAEVIAALMAERERLPRTRALPMVATWLVDDGSRIVHVAERAGWIYGYGKAELIDPVAQGGSGPAGWYLAGLVVEQSARRRGVGRKLTESRLGALADRTDRVWYFANSSNLATIALHRALGFVQEDRDFMIPGVSFEGGTGVLFGLSLAIRDNEPPTLSRPDR